MAPERLTMIYTRANKHREQASYGPFRRAILSSRKVFMCGRGRARIRDNHPSFGLEIFQRKPELFDFWPSITGRPPRLWPGGIRSLTFTAVSHRNSHPMRHHAHERECARQATHDTLNLCQVGTQNIKMFCSPTSRRKNWIAEFESQEWFLRGATIDGASDLTGLFERPIPKAPALRDLL